MVRNSVPILISIAVSASVHIGVCGDKTLISISNENSTVSESYAEENDTWNENDDTEECAGVLDTMLISPEFIEEDDHSQSVFELFFCKKIPLSRRVEYVMDGSMDE